uniref:Uncharacterized protein n=1 Tax=viral metagenome TaxID=1070528 RepID=A0A6C0CY26_9ZZZZ
MSVDKKKIMYKTLKALNTIWHPDSTLVFKSSKERLVIGRYIDNEFISIDDTTLELCNTWGFKYDETLIETEDNNEEEEQDDSEKNENESENDESNSSDNEEIVESTPPVVAPPVVAPPVVAPPVVAPPVVAPPVVAPQVDDNIIHKLTANYSAQLDSLSKSLQTDLKSVNDNHNIKVKELQYKYDQMKNNYEEMKTNYEEMKNNYEQMKNKFEGIKKLFS